MILYTVRTGDESALNRLEWPETCTFCEAVRRLAESRHEEAAVVEGGAGTVEILETYAFDEFAGGYPLDVRITEKDARLLDDQGDLIRVEPGAVGDYRIEVLHDGTSWRLIDIIGLEGTE